MEFTGFNVSEINALQNRIMESYTDLGKKMSEPWPQLQSNMQMWWHGPDEQAYEDRFAKDICKLYVDCREVVQIMIRNISAAGKTWEEFQNRNVIGEGQNSFAQASETFDDVIVPNTDISDVVRLNANQAKYTENRGIESLNAGNALSQSIDNYVTSVKNSVNQLYQSITSTKAFLGGNQSTSIDSYIERMGQGIADLSASHQSIKEALATLMANYQAQSSEISSKMSSAN